MLSHDRGPPSSERWLRHALGMGPRPTAANPDAGQLLVGAAAAVCAAALSWLCFAAGACSYGWACAVSGFAVIVASMGTAKYAEFVSPEAGAESFDEASAPLTLTLVLGGLVLGLMNAAIAAVASTLRRSYMGTLALLLLDGGAALVCAKEREIERWFSAPAQKKRA